MRPLFLALLCLLPLSLSAVPAAMLKWDQSEINVDASWEATETVAEYTFTNMGSEPVTIVDVKTNCGCTAAQPDKKTYAPGESGKIAVTFDHGDRVGEQKKMVAVLTNENGQTGYPLVLNVDIPRAVAVQPQQLQWRKGGHPVTQSLEITVHKSFPGGIARVAMLNPNAPFEVGEVEKISDKRYKVTITPTSTKRSAQEVGAVASNEPADEPKLALFYLLIR